MHFVLLIGRRTPCVVLTLNLLVIMLLFNEIVPFLGKKKSNIFAGTTMENNIDEEMGS